MLPWLIFIITLAQLPLGAFGQACAAGSYSSTGNAPCTNCIAWTFTGANVSTDPDGFIMTDPDVFGDLLLWKSGREKKISI